MISMILLVGFLWACAFHSGSLSDWLAILKLIQLNKTLHRLCKILRQLPGVTFQLLIIVTLMTNLIAIIGIPRTTGVMTEEFNHNWSRLDQHLDLTRWVDFNSSRVGLCTRGVSMYNSNWIEIERVWNSDVHFI